MASQSQNNQRFPKRRNVVKTTVDALSTVVFTTFLHSCGVGGGRGHRLHLPLMLMHLLLALMTTHTGKEMRTRWMGTWKLIQETGIIVGVGETQWHIWTDAQFAQKKQNYPWLTMGTSGLGCAICKRVGSLGPEKTSGVKLAKEWLSGSVSSSAPDFKKQQRAIRKKIFERANTKAHVMASNICDKARTNVLVNTVINAQNEHVQTTARIFRTVYKEAMRHRPSYGFEHEIDCQ